MLASFSDFDRAAWARLLPGRQLQLLLQEGHRPLQERVEFRVAQGIERLETLGRRVDRLKGETGVAESLNSSKCPAPHLCLHVKVLPALRRGLGAGLGLGLNLPVAPGPDALPAGGDADATRGVHVGIFKHGDRLGVDTQKIRIRIPDFFL